MTTENFIQDCNKNAEKLFKNSDNKITKKVLRNIESVRYATDEGSVVVCRDGGMLFAEPFVSAEEHETAFSVGMRTTEKDIFKKFK